MSAADHEPTDLARTIVEALLRRPLAGVVGLFEAAIRWLAFWVAALLPLSYVPMIATGVVTTEPLGFVALTGVNAAALIVGHPYAR